MRDPEYLESVQEGIHYLHSLEYEEAITAFSRLESEYPRHPGPPLDLASTLWLRELFRRRDLDLEKFVAPGYFTEDTSHEMPEEQREAFFRNAERTKELANAFLSDHPGDRDARYYLGAVEGILGAFAITIDGSKTGAFRHGKEAYRYHRNLVNEAPGYYDAYLSVGVYEYVVDNLPWYIKWLATIIGYRGSEERAFEYLTSVANEGDASKEQAQVMLMALYYREERYSEALEMARAFHQQFPKNFLIHLNQAQILEELGRIREAASVYLDVVRLAEQGRASYHKLSVGDLCFELGHKFIKQQWHELALEQFEKTAGDGGVDEAKRARAHLEAGRLAERLGRLVRARRHYQRVLALKEVDDSHDRAREYLQESD